MTESQKTASDAAETRGAVSGRAGDGGDQPASENGSPPGEQNTLL